MLLLSPAYVKRREHDWNNGKYANKVTPGFLPFLLLVPHCFYHWRHTHIYPVPFYSNTRYTFIPMDYITEKKVRPLYGKLLQTLSNKQHWLTLTICRGNRWRTKQASLATCQQAFEEESRLAPYQGKGHTIWHVYIYVIDVLSRMHIGFEGTCVCENWQGGWSPRSLSTSQEDSSYWSTNIIGTDNGISRTRST